jgi:uncharacterized membrane protein
MARVAKAGNLTLEDMAIVTNDDGKIKLQQTRDLNAGTGAGAGGWVGALLGIVGGPLGMVAGGALGATVGGLWAKLRDIGIDDNKMKEMGESLGDGEAALFMLIAAHDCDALARELKRFDGMILETSLGAEEGDILTEALCSEL